MTSYKWIPIEQLEEHIDTSSKEMFVVIGIDVDVGTFGKYTTDPYCVWCGGEWEDGTQRFARWPHNVPPTHFVTLPSKG